MHKEKLQAFVMMPFRDDTQAIRAAIRAGLAYASFHAVLIDEVPNTGKITDNIERSIRRSHLCVCDVSGKNPNVAWEYGYATALGKKVILLAQSKDDLYFDVQNNQAIFYDLQHLDLLTQAIKVALDALTGQLVFTPLEYAASTYHELMTSVAAASNIQHTPYDFFNLLQSAKSHVLIAGQITDSLARRL